MRNDSLTIKDFIPEIILQVAACFMFFIYAPVEFYFTDVDQFTYDVYDILKYMVPVFFAVLVISIVVMILMRVISNKLHDIVLGLYIAVFVAAYIQGSYMSSFLPVLDGHEIIWSDYSVNRIWSVALWAGLIAIVFFIGKKIDEGKRKKFILGIGIAGLALMLLTLGINSFTTDKAWKDKYNLSMSSGYLYDMSDRENFIIFLVDNIDATAYEELLEIHPEYRDYLEDFTYFPDTVGAYPYTSRAVPHILYGKWYENEQGIYDYSAEALKESPLLNSLKDNNYRLTMYMTDFLNIDYSEETFDNITRSEKLVSPVKFIKMQLMFAGFKYLPFDLKQFCNLSLDAIEEDSRRECPIGESYSMSDGWFYEHLNNTDVSVVSQKQFHYIHINGAHNPLEYDANVNKIENGTYEQGIEASLTITGAYLNKLREAGVYDNSVILVLADHGYGRGKEEPFDKQNPVLFVKGRNESHPYSVSKAPVSYADLQDAYKALLGGALSEDAFPFKEGKERERRYLMMVYNDSTLHEYIQRGYAADEETMEETGVYYPAV